MNSATTGPISSASIWRPSGIDFHHLAAFPLVAPVITWGRTFILKNNVINKVVGDNVPLRLDFDSLKN